MTTTSYSASIETHHGPSGTSVKVKHGHTKNPGKPDDKPDFGDWKFDKDDFDFPDIDDVVKDMKKEMDKKYWEFKKKLNDHKTDHASNDKPDWHDHDWDDFFDGHGDGKFDHCEKCSVKTDADWPDSIC